jgi:hypothetical protein
MTINKRAKWISASISASCLLLHGCSSLPRTAPLPTNPKHSQHSAIYNKGYSAGCASGRNVSGDARYVFTKDIAAYSSDAQYRNGWDEAYPLCQEQRLLELQNQPKQQDSLVIDGNGNPGEDTNTTNKIWNELKK